MKSILLFFVISVLSMSLKAQSYEVQYAYDASGNRILRQTVVVEIENQLKAQSKDFEPVLDEWNQREVKLYPNPTRGNLKVSVNGGEKDVNYQYDLYNTGGRLIKSGRIRQKGETRLPMHNLPSGIYFLVLNDGVEKTNYKIIKK